MVPSTGQPNCVRSNPKRQLWLPDPFLRTELDRFRKLGLLKTGGGSRATQDDLKEDSVWQNGPEFEATCRRMAEKIS